MCCLRSDEIQFPSIFRAYKAATLHSLVNYITSVKLYHWTYSGDRGMQILPRTVWRPAFFLGGGLCVRLLPNSTVVHSCTLFRHFTDRLKEWTATSVEQAWGETEISLKRILPSSQTLKMEVTTFITNVGVFVAGCLISEEDYFKNRNNSKF